MRVLLVEDDREIADLIQRASRRVGWATDVADTAASAMAAVTGVDYDLVVLDLGLPDTDGLEVCRQLRRDGRAVPILVLTARGGLTDRITGLDAGADDYLTKPFAVGELMARLRALVRRPAPVLSPTLHVADVQLDPATRRVVRADREIDLTAREFALLEFLMRNAGEVLSRGRILDNVWDDNFDPVGNAVDVLVGRVRRKLDPTGEQPLIHTVRGAGYQLSSREPMDGG